MYIEIHHNTTDGLTDQDKAILMALAGVESAGSAPVSAPAASAPAKAAAKSGKKAEKSAPAPEPEEEDEDLVGGDSPTMEDAVARATELVSSGQAAKLKAALNKAGAKKVSELKPGDIAAFLDELA